MFIKKRKLIFNFFFGFLFIVSLTLAIALGNQKVLSHNENQLVQIGVEQYQSGEYSQAIASWQEALTIYDQQKNLKSAVIVQENIALAYKQLGQTDESITYWLHAIAFYEQSQNWQATARLLIELAQSYNDLGNTRAAFSILCGNEKDCLPKTALKIATTYQDKPIEAAALGVLGDTYRLVSNYQEAIASLEKSLEISSEFKDPIYHISALNSLGSVYISLAELNYHRGELANRKGDTKEEKKLLEKAERYDALALETWQNSLELPNLDNQVTLTANTLVNTLEPLYRNQSPNFQNKLKEAINNVANLPDSRTKVYLMIDLANLVKPDSMINPRTTNYQCLQDEQNQQTEALLNQSLNIAQTIKDNRATSFVLGRLGHFYECEKENNLALSLTQEAILLADQNLKNQDSLYLWEWQAGRIFKTEKQPDKAIKAYERALIIVQQIRSDIVAANRDLQLDFRNNIEPIYRELAALKLQNNLIAGEREINLSQVIKTIDALKIAELENYLGNDCVLTGVNKTNFDILEKQPGTAIFNTIIFPEYTAIIVSLPSGEEKSALINIDQETLRQEINQFRQGLERYRDYNYDTTQAQKIYNWLITPFLEDLEQNKVTSIVFINDGILRTIPLAALYDGQQFLIEKYALAITPSLSLTKTNKTSINPQVLALGVTKSVIIDGQNFAPLHNVGEEIQEVKNNIPNTKSLMDEKFSFSSLEQELTESSYNIIHIATHGQFSSEPENTFLVTGDNNKLTINDLEKAIRGFSQQSELIDLLVLTACQTAVGDDRAALGLAGMAVQSGAKSVFASLWFIQDAATTELVTKFYQNWQSGLSKSEALRLAQKDFLAKGGIYAHPAYWAPFIIIGNWS